MNPANAQIANRHVISDEEVRFFLDNGYLIIRGVLQGEELRRIQSAMDGLTEQGSREVLKDPDFMYGDGHKTGRPILKRIEYVIDKSDACKNLLAHPFILRSVEKIMGRDLIPTWDSMVLKLPGEGIAVPWHRDAGTEYAGDIPIFNVDFYLDAADLNTCVRVVPGSHKWSIERARDFIQQEGFDRDGAIPALMQPGDVLFHNILVLHGSPSNSSDRLRRVIYYEFRTAHVEATIGPHAPEYVPLKQRLLLRCLARRRMADYVSDEEEAYQYNPPAPYDKVTMEPGEEIETYRYPHERFWRK